MLEIQLMKVKITPSAEGNELGVCVCVCARLIVYMCERNTEDVRYIILKKGGS